MEDFNKSLGIEKKVSLPELLDYMAETHNIYLEDDSNPYLVNDNDNEDIIYKKVLMKKIEEESY